MQKNNDFSEVKNSHHDDHDHDDGDIIFFQDKMRDLAERLFSSRCGVNVEKVQELELFHFFLCFFVIALYLWFLCNNNMMLPLQADIAHVELKSVSSVDSVFTKSIFVRFDDLELR